MLEVFVKPGAYQPQAGMHLVSWNHFWAAVSKFVSCVCMPPKLLIIMHMKWNPNNRLNKSFCFPVYICQGVWHLAEINFEITKSKAYWNQ